MKEYNTEEEDIIINSLLSRCERIDRDIQNLKKDLSEEIIKVLSDSKKVDDAKEKIHIKDLSELEGELNSRLTNIEESLKQNHNSHVEQKRSLIMEFENQKQSNQNMIDEGLRLLQKLEYLETRIGRK